MGLKGSSGNQTAPAWSRVSCGWMLRVMLGFTYFQEWRFHSLPQPPVAGFDLFWALGGSLAGHRKCFESAGNLILSLVVFCGWGEPYPCQKSIAPFNPVIDRSWSPPDSEMHGRVWKEQQEGEPSRAQHRGCSISSLFTGCSSPSMHIYNKAH